MTQVESLMTAIATAAAGRPVVATVRPLHKTRGRVLLRGGQLYLEINGNLTRRQVLEVFLHEISHCRHDTGKLKDVGNPAAAGPKLRRLNSAEEGAWTQICEVMEERATRDSQRWARRVRRHVSDNHGLATQLAWLLVNHEVVIK
jgi:hypothetical protein